MTVKITNRLLTIFLIKSAITTPAQIFKNLVKLQKHPVGNGRSKLGDLYVSRSVVRTPRWATLFAGSLDINSLGLKTASAAAVLLIQRGSRNVALAFGQGRHLLNPSSYEENFGLLTTLNAIDPRRVRTLDRKRFDAISRLTREQGSHEVPIFDFGLELERDMLRTLTGLPSDERLGKRLSGRDSLSAAVPAELRDLPALLDLYLGKARGKAYKQRFPGIYLFDVFID